MKIFATVLTLLLATSFSARAGEVTIQNILENLQALHSAAATQECSNVIEESHSKNSAQLFYSAAICAKEKRASDASFLLLAGQIRSTADMGLYAPTSGKDQEAMGALYGLIFYHFGGAGDQSTYRDRKQYNALQARLAAWEPTRASSYNPGWHFKSSPRDTKYQQAISSAKQHRFAQLDNYSKLMLDEQYYAAQQELGKLQSKNPRGFVSDTADGKRSMELLSTMQQRAREITGDR